MEGADVVTPGPARPPDPLYIRKNNRGISTVYISIVRTHKNQSFSSHRPSNGKKSMFFVIPEMPSKTFVMFLKKLPDHFKVEEPREPDVQRAHGVKV